MRIFTPIASCWSRIPAVVLLAVVAIAAAGCGSDAVANSPTSPSLQTMTTSAAGDGSQGGVVQTDAILVAMNRAIQDEYHAEFIYLKVIENFGEVAPFTNIVHAERRHSTVVGRLFTNRGLVIPGSNWNLGNVPVFDSVAAACAAAVVAEHENIALYDELLTQDLPRDVHNVFTNIRAASLNNHLPAFEACCACTQ